MSPELVELRRLADSADPASAARDWALTLGRERLLELRPEIEDLRLDSSWRQGRTLTERRGEMIALTIAELASARTVVQVAQALDDHGPSPEADDVVALAHGLGARWLPKLPQRLIRNRWNSRWRLGRALVRRGLAEHPTDPLYFAQMINGVGPVYSSLVDDQELLGEIWPFFQSDQLGAALGNRDLPTPNWRPAPEWFQIPEEDRFWRVALTRLANEDHIDRARLHRATATALLMDAPWVRLRWYAAMLQELDCTVDELAGETSSYLAMLRSRNARVVAVGQQAVRALLAAGRMRPEEFLDVADAPFFGTDKPTAIAQLQLLESFAADEAWRDDALTAALPALSHRHLDVERAALRLVMEHIDVVDDALRERVARAAEGLAPSLRIGLTFGHASPRPAASVAPPTATLPDPLDDDAFVQLAASMLEGHSSAIDVDRAIEAMLRICGYPLEQRRRLVEPILRRAAEPAMRRTHIRGWIAACVLALGGEPGGSNIDVERLGDLLLREVLEAIGRGVARSYQAMPTRPDGSIDADTAGERRRAAGRDIGPAEVAIAALRSDDGRELIRVDDIGFIVAADRTRLTTQGVPFSFRGSVSSSPRITTPPTPDPWTRTYKINGVEHRYELPGRPVFTGDERSLAALLSFGPREYASPEYLEWLLSTLPHHLDVMTVPLASAISDDMGREPSSMLPSQLNPLLDRISRSDTEVGACAPIVATMALGAKAVGSRLRAMECVIVLVRHKGVDAGTFAQHLTTLLLEQVVMASRVAGTLGDAVNAEPALVRDVVLPTLPAVLGIRDVSRLLEVLTEAVALCGPVSLPVELHDVASQKASTKLVKTARHLVAVATRTPR